MKHIRKAKKLRQKIIRELREQGFEVNGQIEFDFGGVYFKGKFFSHEDLDTRKWGYPRPKEASREEH